MTRILILVALASCAASAEAAYSAALLRCVDKSETPSESKSCRRAVDRQYGVDSGR